MDDDQQDAPNPTAGVHFIIDRNAIAAARLDEILERANSLAWHDLHAVLAEHHSSAEGGQAALALAAAITNYHFVPTDRVEPFRPIAVLTDGRRTLVPQDLAEEQVAELSAVAAGLKHPSFRALVCDVCWFLDRTRSELGFLAVSSYCDCLDAVANGSGTFGDDETSPWDFTAVEFFERACMVAYSLGWHRPEFDRLRALIQHVRLRAFDQRDTRGFDRVAALDLDRGVTEASIIAGEAEALAKDASFDADTRKELWELAARSHHLVRDEQAKNAALISAAACLVEKADSAQPSAMLEAAFLHKAIDALRPIPGTRETRDALHARLREVQPRIRDEMTSHSHETDISELVRKAEEHIQGFHLGDALLALFVANGRPSKPDTLRDQVEENKSKAPLSSMISVDVHDHQGRVVFKAPGRGGTKADQEKRVLYDVAQHRRIQRDFLVKTLIDPMRRGIAAAHLVRYSLLEGIFAQSPFVPDGHEGFFAVGAMRFLAGEDAEAFHLLFPQLENSLRHLLMLNGVDTTKVNHDGTQEESGLSKIMTAFSDDLSIILSERYLEKIRMLFEYRGGPSIRNEAAHGKITYFGFWGSDIIYGSWLILHLALIPLVPNWDDITAPRR